MRENPLRTSRQPLPRFTHKGWFCGIAPVHIADPCSAAPFIHQRHWSLLPLFILAELLFNLYAVAVIALDRDPRWPIRVTGELPR